MLDYENKRYITKNGIIELSHYENIALGFMLTNKGELVVPFMINKRVNTTRLRDKLKGEVEIKTKRGIGYYIEKNKKVR